jgi:hypothetical protein
MAAFRVSIRIFLDRFAPSLRVITLDRWFGLQAVRRATALPSRKRDVAFGCGMADARGWLCATSEAPVDQRVARQYALA